MKNSTLVRLCRLLCSSQFSVFLVLACIFVVSPVPAFGVGTVIWEENFEGGFPPDWSVSSGVWQVGVPSSGPGRAHSPSNCTATILNGNYPAGASSQLRTHRFTVPAADQFPRLRFWHWFGTYNAADFGKVQISVAGGAWQDVSTNFWYYGGRVWTDTCIDLRPFAGQDVRLAFYFQSDSSGNDPGWYIDDVRLVTGQPTLNFPESFEGGWGDWCAENGVWEIGVPSSGPGSAHTGRNVAATWLGGDYWDYSNGSRLISPSFTVPAADQFPRLRFWHWFGTYNAADFGKVQISVAGGAWQDIPVSYSGGAGGVWTPVETSLTNYAGQNVRLALYFQSDSSGNDSGWYVDDLCVESGNVGINPITPRTINEHSQVSFSVTARGTNVNSDLEFYIGAGAPEGAAINIQSGQFTWTPSEAQGPSINGLSILVVDKGNLSATTCAFFTIQVNEVNESPVMMEPERRLEIGQLAAWSLCAVDADIPRNALTYMRLSGPAGLIISAAGQVTWTPTQLGSNSVTVKVTDNNPDAVNTRQLSTTNTFTLTVVPNLPRYFLHARRLLGRDFEFTILEGTIGTNYVLQCAPFIIDCPPTNHWQDITNVLATSMPFTFGYTEPQLGGPSNRFYRLRTQ